MERLRSKLSPGVVVAAIAAIALGFAAGGAPAKGNPDTVTISGRAYAFNHMDTFLAGAKIKIRELPGVSATTDENGDYELKLPNDTTVTPYIVPPEGYNQIDLQTFHTRGADIENANFQTPGDLEYKGLAALLGVPIGDDGRPEQCVIVTTASKRNVRGVDYDTFHERTPHGVAGATAKSAPPLPDPIYFNENVIPDPSQPSTSGDGGIIWTGVPAGSYRISTEAPDHRFAGFLATCKPGRVVNANPPWGAYELKKKETPLRSGVAVGTARKVRATRDAVEFRVIGAEALRVKARLRSKGRTIAKSSFRVKPGGHTGVAFTYDPKARGGRATLKLTYRDAAGDEATAGYRLTLPE
jgi:hypothetical protein